MRSSSDIIDEQERQQAPIQEMAEDKPARRKGWRIAWELTESAWEKLRARIKSEPNLEGNDFEEKYENLRKGVRRRFALTKLFDDECIDETLDRVAKAIEGGASIDNLPAYCNRVAHNVLIDFVKDPLNRVDEIDDTTAPPPIPPDPLKEQRAECLEECLKKRPEEERELVLKYYQDCKSKQREEMANDLTITIDALRKRAQRIRDKLEECIMDCLKKSGFWL
jgi:RNA polymerase sigma factor (sigma-70 family)